MMKKLILIMLLPFMVKGQIVLKTTPELISIGKAGDNEMSLMILKKDSIIDSVYCFRFKNEDYQTITDMQSILFRNKKGELKGFYDILKSFYSPDNINNKDYKVSFTLYKTDISLSRNKKTIFFYTNKGFCSINEKDIDNLFNKH